MPIVKDLVRVQHKNTATDKEIWLFVWHAKFKKITRIMIGLVPSLHGK